ncbi:MAG TPA: glycosyltransferase family 61 protein [Sphingomicrobium sp.]|nr:glycosyltransferase family 61 protein [Sphingomicrobium sp.]
MPAATVPAQWLVGARTRLVDSWTPAPEMVRMPPILLQEGKLILSIAQGVSKAPTQSLRRRVHNLVHRAPKVLHGAPGTAYFDARFDGLHNFSHMFFLVGPLGLLARKFCREDAGIGNFAVVVRSTARDFAVEALRTLNLDVIRSDADLHGMTVRIEEQGRYLPLRLLGDLLPAGLAQKIQAGPPTPPKIYLARRGTRSIVNAEEIDPIIERFGYRKIYLEDLPILEQIRTVALASEIVAVHGAALGPLAWRTILPPSRLKLVEIFSPGYIVSLYREIAALLGGDWIGVRGRHSPEFVRDLDQRGQARSHEAAPIDVDPEALRLAIDYSEQGRTGDLPYTMVLAEG